MSFVCLALFDDANTSRIAYYIVIQIINLPTTTVDTATSQNLLIETFAAIKNRTMSTIAKTITIGSKTNNPIQVNRLGYGTMRLPGDMVWGEPKDRAQALAILKATQDKGVNFLDTADFYGEDVTNRLIAEALYPYQTIYSFAQKLALPEHQTRPGWYLIRQKN